MSFPELDLALRRAKDKRLCDFFITGLASLAFHRMTEPNEHDEPESHGCWVDVEDQIHQEIQRIGEEITARRIEIKLKPIIKGYFISRIVFIKDGEEG